MCIRDRAAVTVSVVAVVARTVACVCSRAAVTVSVVIIITVLALSLIHI